MFKTKRYNGEVREFASLNDAVRHIGAPILRFRGFFRRTPVSWTGREYCLGDTHIVYDELDLPVPVGVLKEVYLNLPEPSCRCGGKRHVKAEHYRRQPVPYTSSAGNWGSYYRSPRTSQEHRQIAALSADDELREYGIRPRRGRSDVPTDWDDLYHRYHTKSWKRQRRTRWR